MKLAMHILKGRPNGPLFERCIASANASGIDYSVIPGQGTDIILGRHLGFDVNASHVTMLDDDDESLLTKAMAERLMALNMPAVFTNAQVVGGKDPYQVPPYMAKWSLGYENNRTIRPHAAMIIQTHIAHQVLLETEKIIKAQGWDRSFCDFVFRLVISNGIGWHYDPCVAYRWYIHALGHHQVHASKFAGIRQYFFGRN